MFALRICAQLDSIVHSYRAGTVHSVDRCGVGVRTATGRAVRPVLRTARLRELGDEDSATEGPRGALSTDHPVPTMLGSIAGGANPSGRPLHNSARYSEHGQSVTHAASNAPGAALPPLSWHPGCRCCPE